MLTSSLATMPGKRFVTCRISRTIGRSGIARRYYGAADAVASGKGRRAGSSPALRIDPVRCAVYFLGGLILPDAICFETAVSFAISLARLGALTLTLPKPTPPLPTV